MRKLCPKCQGGRSRELSLSSVEVSGVTAWRCWRAKCGYRTIMLTSDAPPQTELCHRPLPQVLPVTSEVRQYLIKYHIDTGMGEHYGLSATTHARLMLPIYSPRGALRGWNVRGTRQGQAKANIHCTGNLTLAWYRADAGAAFELETAHGISAELLPMLAVEDQLSAVRIAAAGLTACSLLGTNVSQAKILEIDKVSHGRWLLALDADAIGKALLHTQRHDIRVLRLSRDAKNCTPLELHTNVIQRAIHAIGGSNQQQGNLRPDRGR